VNNVNQIRPLAICVFSRDGRILAAEGFDPLKQETFYRSLGGGIEFGETGEETARRELREEIGAEVAEVHYLGALENIFTFNGQPGHEIVLVYDGRFADETLYAQTEIHGQEDEELGFIATWKALDEFGPGAPLYPDGLVEMLRENEDRP
jgi:8-oxo-dGTP pyrophosphatase MutT (NUDIX family)